MKLKFELIFQHLGDQWMGVPVGADANDCNCVLQVNDVGHDIMSMLATDVEREDIIAKLLETYDIQRAEVESHVDDFLAKLREKDLIC